MMPASRATPSTSPLATPPSAIRRTVSGFISTRARAVARRSVTSLSLTSTMRALPSASIWVSRAMAQPSAARAPGVSGAEQRRRRRRHVGLAHQRFADQEAADAERRHAREIGRRVEPALADDRRAVRRQRREALGGREIDRERLEVAVVDAEQRGVERERAGELRLVVDLDQRVHAERRCRRRELGRLTVAEGGHDEQDAVRAERARLRYLIGVEHEVLAQHGQRHRRARVSVRNRSSPWK